MSIPRRTPPFRDPDSRAEGTERAQEKAAGPDPDQAPPIAGPPDGSATDEPAVRRDGPDAEGGPERPTVLIVEDNARLRRFLRHLLEPEYHVLEAKNGREGLLRARRSMPSLIVSDVRMPEVDGLTMVERLRRSPRTRHIPMMVLTVRSRVEDRREGLKRGAVAYLTKPFDVEVLIAQIRSLISNRQQLRARFHDDWTAENPETSEREGLSSFEDRVRSTVRRHLANPDFTVEQLADEVGLARRTVTRKTKEHLGQTPSQFIRTMRVERGAKLLAETTETVSQIAYAVGFNSLSYFSRSFRAHFGVPPSIYRSEET